MEHNHLFIDAGIPDHEGAGLRSGPDMAATESMTKSAELSEALRSAPWKRISLLAILFSAFALRVAGISSGLPLVLFNDEGFLVGQSLAINWSDLNPHAFVWGSLPFYLLRLVTWAGDSLSSLATGHLLSLGDSFLLSRLVSVVLGTATVLLVFALGKLLADWKVGLLGAALFAVSPFSVEVSHYATVDPILAFWSTLALVGMALHLQGSRRGLDLAGIASGLAIATKYNAALLLIGIVMLAFFAQRAQGATLRRGSRILFGGVVTSALLAYVALVIARQEILNLVATWTINGELRPYYIQMFDRIMMLYLVAVFAGIVLAIGTALGWRWATRIVSILTSQAIVKPILLATCAFIIVSPFAILDFPNFVRGAFYPLSKQMLGGAVGYDPSSRDYLAALNDLPPLDPLHYAEVIFSEWGALVFAAILAGMWALWRTSRHAFVAFALLLGLALGGSALGRYYGTRYIYYVWGLVAVLGAWGSIYLLTRMSSLVTAPYLRRFFSAAFIAVLLAFPARSSFDTVNWLFLSTDTRSLAWEWIERNIPPGTYILREWDTPEIERVSSSYRIYLTGTPFEEGSLSQWKERGVGVVLLSDTRYWFYQEHADTFQDVLREYDALKKEGRLLQRFSAGPGIKGPTIFVYAMP